MAVSKIIVVRSRLDRCLAYIRNPDKTTLSLELDNAATPGQSETICLETAFNCQLQTAYAEMVETKVVPKPDAIGLGLVGQVDHRRIRYVAARNPYP